MLNISKALNAEAVQTYHKQFTSEVQNYYKQGNTVQGEWQGELAAKFGLAGKVGAEEFARLTEGQHPVTGEQLVKHRTPQQQVAADGTVTNAVAHRAGWDAQFAPPKSVSLTALVGGDDRVREAHDHAVSVALTELERYTQARIGGNNAAETTGKFVAAKFEHDTARPVDGYAAPQLHTHVVIFNVTERADGSTRALQERALFESQNFATAVYQSALTYKLRDLGYELETGRSGAPEIKGYSQAYLDASSLRSQQIKERLEQLGLAGPAAAQFAAYATRSNKEALPPAEVLAAHKEMAVAFGNQPDQVIAAARQRAQTQQRSPDRALEARQAVSYSRTHNFEREAVSDERGILRDAMRRGMGETTYADIKVEFDSRLKNGDFVEREAKKHDTGRRFTTPETIAAERANIAHVLDGQNTAKPIMSKLRAQVEASSHPGLNSAQHRVIEEVLTSKDRVHGLQGLAGTGKTTTLKAIRQGAEQEGYTVEGFAPTSKAAGELRDAKIEATTLQSFLLRKPKEGEKPEDAPRHLYMLDESSLASTQQMKRFLDKLNPQDRVLVIGDTRQHQGVDAGRPFEQMQDAGMQTSRLDQIMRQKGSPDLLHAVQQLAQGKVEEGVRLLGQQGRITEIADAKDRIAAIAKDYIAQPANTLIVSPDNRSRQAINDAVRSGMRETGALAADGQQFTTLAHRSDMTGADRTWAARYQPGDILKYTKGRQSDGLEKNSYATVTAVDGRANTITVRQADGHSLTYDPRRLQGVNVYVEQKREVATGDRIQFTASDKDMGIANRDLGTVIKMKSGEIQVKMDGQKSRTITFDPAVMRHFDHGYAVTSHSSQGLTQGRVLANIDTDSSRSLINSRLAYVAISRASTDVRIYTNRAETLGARLATEVSKSSAVDFNNQTRSAEKKHSLHDYATSWLKDYKAAITPGEKIQPLPLRGNILEKALTLAADSEPARIKRVINLLSYGSTENKATVANPDPAVKQTRSSRSQPEPPVVRTYADPTHRLAAVAADYLAQPKGTVILAPDLAERKELTKLIRADLQVQGLVSPDSQLMTVLAKHNVKNPKLAADYTPGDRIHFGEGNKEAGIASNSAAVVIAINAKANKLTVRNAAGEDITYRPHLTKGMTTQSTVYRAEQREIAPGDRVQITQADGKNGLRLGDLGTVIKIENKQVPGAGLELQLDHGKAVSLTAAQAKHIEYGYAIQSAKWKNIERVLVSQDAVGSTDPRELAALSRAKETTLYISESSQLKQPAVPAQTVEIQAIQVQAVQVQAAQAQAVPAQVQAPAVPAQVLPVQQSQAPENFPVPDAPAVQQRHSMRH